MQPLNRVLVCCLWVWVVFPVHLYAAEKTLDQEVETLLASLPEESVKGVVVREVATGKVLFTKNAALNLMPASTLKVLTATAAYQVLGKNFHYTTAFYGKTVPGQPRHLKGLSLKFSGDPSLTRADISNLISSIKNSGYRKVDGNVWLDGSIYTGYPKAQGVVWNDLGICFAAPSSAMILDHNCFYAELKPARVAGKKTMLEYEQPGWPFRVDNQTMTLAPEEADDCELDAWPSPDQEYRLEGCVAVGAQPIKLAFSVADPEQAVKRFVVSEFQKQGITVKGRVIIGKPDKPFEQVLAEHTSPPLPVLLNQVLERSDNLYSDTLLKTLGARLTERAGSYGSGTLALKQQLEKSGINLGNAYFADGSGLSRYNLISANAMVNVLDFAWGRWGKESPWLAERKKTEYWYKTGTMNSVNAVAGYVFPEKGKPLILVVMLNGVTSGQFESAAQQKKNRQKIRVFRKQLLDLLIKSV